MARAGQQVELYADLEQRINEMNRILLRITHGRRAIHFAAARLRPMVQRGFRYQEQTVDDIRRSHGRHLMSDRSGVGGAHTYFTSHSGHSVSMIADFGNETIYFYDFRRVEASNVDSDSGDQETALEHRLDLVSQFRHCLMRMYGRALNERGDHIVGWRDRLNPAYANCLWENETAEDPDGAATTLPEEQGLHPRTRGNISWDFVDVFPPHLAFPDEPGFEQERAIVERMSFSGGAETMLVAWLFARLGAPPHVSDFSSLALGPEAHHRFRVWAAAALLKDEIPLPDSPWCEMMGQLRPLVGEKDWGSTSPNQHSGPFEHDPWYHDAEMQQPGEPLEGMALRRELLRQRNIGERWLSNHNDNEQELAELNRYQHWEARSTGRTASAIAGRADAAVDVQLREATFAALALETQGQSSRVIWEVHNMDDVPPEPTSETERSRTRRQNVVEQNDWLSQDNDNLTYVLPLAEENRYRHWEMRSREARDRCEQLVWERDLEFQQLRTARTTTAPTELEQLIMSPMRTAPTARSRRGRPNDNGGDSDADGRPTRRRRLRSDSISLQTLRQQPSRAARDRHHRGRG